MVRFKESGGQAMMIARWQIEARFGHKPTVIDPLKKWPVEIGAQIGWTENRVRILTGSIGALKSTALTKILMQDLAELNTAWNKLGKIEPHKEWSKELEPHIVSGTPRSEILRVV